MHSYVEQHQVDYDLDVLLGRVFAIDLLTGSLLGHDLGVADATAFGKVELPVAAALQQEFEGSPSLEELAS